MDLTKSIDDLEDQYAKQCAYSDYLEDILRKIAQSEEHRDALPEDLAHRLRQERIIRKLVEECQEIANNGVSPNKGPFR